MNRVEQYLNNRLNERIQAGNLRRLPENREGIDFCSNDYLGIATKHLLALPENKSTGCTGATGATGARLLSGNSSEMEELETTIATFHNAEAALLFNSGYNANTGLFSAIASRSTVFLYDELSHASIIDGIRQSQCKNKYRFNHNDLAALEELLQKHTNDTDSVIVAIETVYSMDGDVAPLREIVELCEQYGALLIADEAHATGVIGNRGEGLVASLGLQNRVFARVHTFGKALGCHGAAVLGSALLKQYLLNFARTLIYTTALPGQSVQAIKAAYTFLSAPEFTNKSLQELTQYFKSKAQEAGIAGLIDSNTPIQPLVIGDNNQTRQLAQQLQDAGILVHPIMYPTVPEGKARLRICLHTFNTHDEIDLLIKLLSA